MAISSLPYPLGISQLYSSYCTESPEHWHVFQVKSVYTVLFSSGVTACPTTAPIEKTNGPADFSSLKAANPWDAGMILGSGQRWKEHHSLIVPSNSTPDIITWVWKHYYP